MRRIMPQVTNAFDEFNLFGIGENSVQCSILRPQCVQEALVSRPNILLSYSELEALIHKQGNVVKTAKDERIIKIQVVAYLESEFLPFPFSALRRHLLYLVKQ